MSRFYDDFAEYYDLVFADWEASMARQATAIAGILGPPGTRSRVLDVAAGIGTQSLPLAAMGYRMTARDLSAGAVARLRREAGERGLDLDVDVGDMRDLGSFSDGAFDAVLAFDNAVPHLPTDGELRRAFREFRRVLAPGGVVLLSVRDYDAVDRTPHSSHAYGERWRAGRRFRLRQEWVWVGPDHYRPTMIVEEADTEGGEWRERVRTTTTYYAVPIPHLLSLMGEAGLAAEVVGDASFYQPVLRGRVGR